MILIGIPVIGASCAPQAELEPERRERARDLTGEIVKMAPETNHRQAQKFSDRAVDAAARQGEEWNVDLSPWLHNGMVNVGLRPAGLCYEWANALYEDLDGTVPSGLKMTLVRSSWGTMREHHAISLHERNEPWSDGILLDGWEQAGKLVYLPIGESKRTWEFEAEKPFHERRKGSIFSRKETN